MSKIIITTIEGTDIEIPLVDGQKAVVGIFFNQFRKNAKSIVIPEGIANIACGTFKNCNELKSLFLPASISKIGAGAFDNCDNITVHCFNDYVERFCYAHGINVFRYNK